MSKYIQRLLITALVLLLSVVGSNGSARHRGGKVACITRFARDRHALADIKKEDHSPAKDGLPANGWSASSVAGLPEDHGANYSGPLAICLDVPGFHFLQHAGSTIEVRRWRLLSSDSRRALLRGLYPKHAFW